MTPLQLHQEETHVSYKNADLDVKTDVFETLAPRIVPRAWAALGEPMEAHGGTMGGHGQSIGSPWGVHWGSRAVS